MSGANFTFVLSTPKGEVTQSERLRVRSSCMKGRNKRQDSRRSLREARRAASAAKKNEDGEPQDRSTIAIKAVADTPPPPPPPLDGDLIPFVHEVDRTSREMLHRFLLYSRLKHEFYTIDFIVNFDKYMTDHSPWLLTDDAFFHSVIMSTSAMQDFFLGQPLSDMTLYHLRKTLALLNQRLSDGELYQMDSTIWIILTLAMVSGFFCDFSTTGTHIAGLRQIVHLQGGRRFLEARPKMQFKLESLEFSSCLSSGAKARLWGPPMTWDPIFPSSSAAPIHIPFSLSHDERLMAVFSDLRELVALANSHVVCESRLDGAVFQTAISSIRYRSLFLLEDERFMGTTGELLCLGMLAFLTTTFAVPGRRLPYPYLATRVRDATWTQGITALRGSCHLGWWLLLMCAMTVVQVENEGDKWFRDLWVGETNIGMKWFTLRQHMQKIAWFPNIHDRLGRRTFFALGERSGS